MYSTARKQKLLDDAITVHNIDISRYKGNARALCLDYGDRRIGIAVSDMDLQIASPFKVINSHGCFPMILSIVDEYSVGLVVVGMPYALNGGNAGKQRKKVEKFIDKLTCLVAQKFTEQNSDARGLLPIQIITWDERYSSVEAGGLLREACASKKTKRSCIDKLAASIILQGALDALVSS
ncbi:MAG: Holliday junction resolvase RuvX [Holosporales bacterium]|jgi:putative Holliday junction resolvase|nr:Holliday junction resolvase RuvX [Holosporales bacterium]